MNGVSYSQTVFPVIRRAREMLLPFYGKIEFREKQGPGNLVTELDIAIEKLYKSEFAKMYPDISFVGEETGGDRSAKHFWLVDPIDGTSHFIRGLPFCTSQLALIKEGEVVFSVVYDFVNDVLCHAEKGKGAFANDTPLSVSERLLGGSRISTVFNLQVEEVYRDYLKLQERCHSFYVGASGYELSQIASGKIDGAVYCGSPGSKDYDVAPGALLVKEAGGMVANIGATTYDYRNRNFIAANPLVFKELTEGPAAIFPIQP